MKNKTHHDFDRSYFRKKALKALDKAKEIEKERINNDYHWISEGKSRRLVKK